MILRLVDWRSVFERGNKYLLKIIALLNQQGISVAVVGATSDFHAFFDGCLWARRPIFAQRGG